MYVQWAHLSALVFAILAASCAGGPAAAEQNKGRRSAYLSRNWHYDVIITKEGTRSEGRIGRLSYRGFEIDGYFDTVVTAYGCYVFRRRSQLWGFGGYRSIELPAEPREIKESFSAADAERGWYFGALYERKRGTPESWLCISREGALPGGEDIEAWIYPEDIADFVESFSLEIRLPTAEPKRR
ncbi:MAG: hypothetical protein K9L66_00235 [Spirochaetaceae bacterium]|nr:hypothetical protein [Spirochaetaceae bacterium]MCF7950038.1 hypothetical protein [Spirochaetaceae bacterium]